MKKGTYQYQELTREAKIELKIDALLSGGTNPLTKIIIPEPKSNNQ
jgi:hypothetical protein